MRQVSREKTSRTKGCVGVDKRAEAFASLARVYVSCSQKTHYFILISHGKIFSTTGLACSSRSLGDHIVSDFLFAYKGVFVAFVADSLNYQTKPTVGFE